MPLDPLIYAYLNGMTTTELEQLVDKNSGNDELLNAVLVTLAPRKDDNSVQLRKRVSNSVGGPTATADQRPWYRRPAAYLLGLVGIVAVGVGHGVGGEIWKFVWPQVQRLLH
jgi:hypothetical protein